MLTEGRGVVSICVCVCVCVCRHGGWGGGDWIDLLFEVDVDHVVVSQAAVGRRVELLQTAPQAAQEPGDAVFRSV